MWISLSGLVVLAAIALAVVIFIIHSLIDWLRGKARMILINLGALSVSLVVLMPLSDFLDKHESLWIFISVLSYAVPNYVIRKIKLPNPNQT
jgi:hypothetical protein